MFVVKLIMIIYFNDTNNITKKYNLFFFFGQEYNLFFFNETNNNLYYRKNCLRV